MGYAYLDEYGIMHVTNHKSDAEAYAKFNGKVKAYKGEFKGGYPLYEGNEVVVRFKDGKFNVSAVTKSGASQAVANSRTFIDFAKELI